MRDRDRLEREFMEDSGLDYKSAEGDAAEHRRSAGRRRTSVRKERKAGRIIILAAFALIICFSKVLWLFAEPHMDDANYENREKAPRPEFTLDTYPTYSRDYTAYFNDHIPFRNDLISLNSSIDYFCFARSSSDDVIIGKDNWLFYSKKEDGDPIACYQGTSLFTEEELKAIAKNCKKQRDYLSKKGKEFVIFIAPNKERVYCEYMPSEYGPPAENYPALQVYNYLKENTDLRVVYAYDDLMEAKEKIEENIYYKTDTHWNYIGAYIGAAAMLSELGIDMPRIYSDKITINTLDETSGDLAALLNMSRQLKSADREYSIDGYDLHDREIIESDINGMIRFHAKKADPRSIYVIRDSFCTHMQGYIGSQFTDTYLRHRHTYTYDDLAACDPDIVVYETVERDVGKLGSFSLKKKKR